jgi:hypothetical protein
VAKIAAIGLKDGNERIRIFPVNAIGCEIQSGALKGAQAIIVVNEMLT